MEHFVFIRVEFSLDIVQCVDKQEQKGVFHPTGYSHFPNTFLAILHTSLALVFIYCGYKPSVAKLIMLYYNTAQSQIISP